MRITERYDVIVQETLRRVTVGEDQVDHEVIIETAPIPGTPQRRPLLVIVLTMSGLKPGERIGDMIMFESVDPPREDVDLAVQNCLFNLRQAKLAMVSQLCDNALEV